MKNQSYLAYVMVSMVVGLSVRAAEPAPIDVGSRRQLFLDTLFVQEAKGVQLITHGPRKTGEKSLTADRPWERGGLGPYSSVLWDRGQYHFWYHAMDSKLWHTSPTSGAICYATSTDGITWQKPDLGLIEYEGDKHNNIVIGHGAAELKIGQDGMMVFADPNAPEDQRFRMVNRFNPRGGGDSPGLNVMSSGDGIHWKMTHQGVLTYRSDKIHHLDSQNVIFWDEGKSKYVAYVRRNLRGEGGGQGRAIARGESAQLGEFPVLQDLPLVLKPDPVDVAQGTGSVVDYYASAAMQYPWAERAYVMFPQAYYHYTKALRAFAKEAPTNAGPIDTQFAASRDGVTWERYDRRPFLGLGMKGEFDRHSVRLVHGMVPSASGNELYLYYRGSDWLHGWDRDERNRKLLTAQGLGASEDVTIISRVVLRRDGFVSVSAGEEGGEFITPPLRTKGNRLLLNLDTSAVGNLRVACLDENGAPLPGFGLGDCDIIHTANDPNHVVLWRGAPDLPPGSDVVRLKFVLKNTDLYAFQFVER